MEPNDSEPNRRTFTLVNAVAAIFLVILVIGLLLPALSQRSSDRNHAGIRCIRNLKILGLACLNYESSHKQLPTGAKANGFGWPTELLPFLEEEQVYNLVKVVGKATPPEGKSHFDLTLPGVVANDPHAVLRSKSISLFRCPAAAMETDRTQDPAEGDYFTLHYYGCMGAKGDGYPVAANSQGGFANTGVLLPDKAIKINQIKDGTSNTILLFEICRDTPPKSDQGEWSG